MTGVPGLTVKRMRGRKLQGRNKRLAQEQPFCARCLKQGRYRIGTQTDHKIALVNGGTDDEDNLQRLCDPCHEDKTQEDMGRTPKKATGLDGWPVDRDGGE